MSSRGVRVAIIVSFAVLVLLGGSAVSQGQAPDDSVSRARPAPVSYPVAAGQPPGTIVTSSGVHEIPSGSIAITDLGVLPAVITVTVGAQVYWVNNTVESIQISNQLFGRHLYLPMIVRPGGRILAGADANGLAAQSAVANWISDPIAPGGQYGRVFAEAGAYPFYASHIDGAAGVVTVVSDTLANTTWVEAEAGGTIAAGASTLEIPPGALAQDSTITVAEPISGTTMQADGMMMVGLEPSGLIFSRPATLTLSYGDAGSFDEEFLQVVAFNEQTGEWEPQEILAQDEQQHTVTVKTEHFSWRLIWFADPLYVVMELPAKFLKPGHVLVRMDGHYDASKPNNGCDGTADWFPGHTGVFSETLGSSIGADAPASVIESNRFLDIYDPDGIVNCTQRDDSGVRELSYSDFLTSGCGFYMGAMRNPNATDEQARTARNNAAGKLGSGYLAVGQGNLLSDIFGYQCYSCVGLVENAYDDAGANIIAFWDEGAFITPLQQYRKLRPVDEITVRVGELVQVPVKAIALDPLHLNYRASATLPTAASLPAGSTFSGGIFNWTPQAGDGGKDFAVFFEASVTVGGVTVYGANQSLTIHVLAANDPTPTPAPGPDTAEEILIPAGNFQMGCDSPSLFDGCYSVQRPLHTVYLNAYSIDKYEVTNARYQACVDVGGCTAPQSANSKMRSNYYGNPTYADYPVINVTWHQADAFCAWAGKRLPTEAEWEKAARGNIDTRKYPWGDAAPTCATVNLYDNVSGAGYCVGDTDQVGARSAGASHYGVMDMAGNVWEWVNDWYDSAYYSVSPLSNPQGPTTGSKRVARGGSWGVSALYVRSDHRLGSSPGDWGVAYGFRCARSQ